MSQMPEGAAIWRSIYGEDARWTLDRQLLAAVVDNGALSLWQHGSGKKRDRPKPFPRPGVDRPVKHGSTSLTPAAARALLDSRKPKRR